MEPPNTKLCKNCKKEIAAENYLMHEIHCGRHLYVCDKCDESVPRSRKEEHDQEMHALTRCDMCRNSFEIQHIEKHKKSECDRRSVHCSYCELDFPLIELLSHEDYCGSRTETCDLCHQQVMLRDALQHEATGCAYRSNKPPPSESSSSGLPGLWGATGGRMEDVQRGTFDFGLGYNRFGKRSGPRTTNGSRHGGNTGHGSSRGYGGNKWRGGSIERCGGSIERRGGSIERRGGSIERRGGGGSSSDWMDHSLSTMRLDDDNVQHLFNDVDNNPLKDVIVSDFHSQLPAYDSSLLSCGVRNNITSQSGVMRDRTERQFIQDRSPPNNAKIVNPTKKGDNQRRAAGQASTSHRVHNNDSQGHRANHKNKSVNVTRETFGSLPEGEVEQLLAHNLAQDLGGDVNVSRPEEGEGLTGEDGVVTDGRVGSGGKVFKNLYNSQVNRAGASQHTAVESPHPLGATGVTNGQDIEDQGIPCEFCGDNFPLDLLEDHMYLCRALTGDDGSAYYGNFIYADRGNHDYSRLPALIGSEEAGSGRDALPNNVQTPHAQQAPVVIQDNLNMTPDSERYRSSGAKHQAEDLAMWDSGAAMFDTGTAMFDTGTAMFDTGTAMFDTGTAMFEDSCSPMEEEQVMIPCEFCQNNFPMDMLFEHQNVCDFNSRPPSVAPSKVPRSHGLPRSHGAVASGALTSVTQGMSEGIFSRLNEVPERDTDHSRLRDDRPNRSSREKASHAGLSPLSQSQTPGPSQRVPKKFEPIPRQRKLLNADRDITNHRQKANNQSSLGATVADLGRVQPKSTRPSNPSAISPPSRTSTRPSNPSAISPPSRTAAAAAYGNWHTLGGKPSTGRVSAGQTANNGRSGDQAASQAPHRSTKTRPAAQSNNRDR